jgi:phenol hydroxylase P0 protein
VTQPSFDVTRKFVRIMETRPNGFVEFEFAIGEPDVCVELVMPQAAFDEFCRDNQVEFLGAGSAPAADCADADFHWSLRQATQQRFR